MIEKKIHILVVSQYFYPEQFRINDICIEWIRRGYKVTVLTGIPNYPRGKFFDGYSLRHKRVEEWNGINIIRIPIIPRGHNSISLIMNYISFVVSGAIWKTFTNINADCVFNYEVSPMTQSLVGVWYANKKNIPSFLYVTDLWPDNVEIITGVHNKQILGSINIIVNYIYKHSTMIFTSSKGFITKMVERGVLKQKLQFWPQYAEDFYIPYNVDDKRKLMKEINIPNDGNFNLVFAGNIGYAQGLEVLIKAANYLKNLKTYVRFNIIGDGRYKEQMYTLALNTGVLDYFNFIDRQPAENIPLYMAACDAAIICLSKSDIFSMTIPAKTQSCLACGMPILASADGEIRQIIEDAKCGLSSPAEDAVELAKNILQMSKLPQNELKVMGCNSLAYYKQHFDKKILLDEMDNYMKGRK